MFLKFEEVCLCLPACGLLLIRRLLCEVDPLVGAGRAVKLEAEPIFQRGVGALGKAGACVFRPRDIRRVQTAVHLPRRTLGNGLAARIRGGARVGVVREVVSLASMI